MCRHQKLWLTDSPLPQFFIFKRGGDRRPEVNTVGFHCWYDYLSNPKSLRLFVSKNGTSFVEWDTFLLPRVVGETRFKIRPVSADYAFFKLVVNSNYGDEVTYLNNVAFYHDPALTNPPGALNGTLTRPLPLREEGGAQAGDPARQLPAG